MWRRRQLRNGLLRSPSATKTYLKSTFCLILRSLRNQKTRDVLVERTYKMSTCHIAGGFTQVRRRRRGQRRLYLRISRLSGSVQCVYGCQNYQELDMCRQYSVLNRNISISPSWFKFSRGRRLWSFYDLVCRRRQQNQPRFKAHVRSHSFFFLLTFCSRRR